MEGLVRDAKAAVAVLVCGEPPGEAVLLIRRPPDPADPWSGTWALPGGRAREEDADLIETALRELQEECGVSLDRSRLADRLEACEAGRPGSLVKVAPFVFRLPERPAVVLDPREAAEARWLPLRLLHHPEKHRRRTVPGQPPTRWVPGFDLEPVPLWGFTYRLLCNWLQVPVQQE